MRRLLIGPLAASAAIATMLIGSATVASATHTVEIGDTGALLAKGAGVAVPVTVTCQPDTLPPSRSPVPQRVLGVRLRHTALGQPDRPGFGIRARDLQRHGADGERADHRLPGAVQARRRVGDCLVHAV